MTVGLAFAEAAVAHSPASDSRRAVWSPPAHKARIGSDRSLTWLTAVLVAVCWWVAGMATAPPTATTATTAAKEATLNLPPTRTTPPL
jgi:hypothetical protein